MKDKAAYFPVSDPENFKMKMLNWSRRFNIFCFLDNNKYSFEFPAFDFMLAAGAERSCQLKSDNSFDQLKDFSDANPGWLFGHFSYPETGNPGKIKDEIGFAPGFFFVPQVVIRMISSQVSIESLHIDPSEILNSILEQADQIFAAVPTKTDIKSRYTKETYVEIIEAIKKHILHGDCYEINFCQDFISTEATVDPLFLFKQLNSISPNPFAAFYKLDDKYCICASPERFLQRSGDTLISQPIKGTSKRDLNDAEIDRKNRDHLLNSQKEKSENVMIVDLVRNDMSKICMEGSVIVKELFGIYSFPQVHQMISTIECKVAPGMHWTDIIEACFPMGSMTGAPKVKVMELIDNYEISPRGLFSGTIGYVNPQGNFDFNVVIRSIFYNSTRKTLSYKAGGGITFNSDACEEYEESMTKASAIKSILS